MKIETKFAVRDKAWVLDGYEIRHLLINGIRVTQRWGITETEYQFLDSTLSLTEDKLFKTKEELIKYITK